MCLQSGTDNPVPRLVPPSSAVIQVSMVAKKVEFRDLGATVLVYVPLCSALRVEFRLSSPRSASADKSRNRGQRRGQR